jgi:hypothetical protein
MNKVTKSILGVLIVGLVLGLAFYPKIKKSFSKEKTEEQQMLLRRLAQLEYRL